VFTLSVEGAHTIPVNCVVTRGDGRVSNIILAPPRHERVSSKSVPPGEEPQLGEGQGREGGVPLEDVTLGGQRQPQIQENRSSLHVEYALGGCIRVLELPHEEGAGPAAGNDGVGSLVMAPLCKLCVIRHRANTRYRRLSDPRPRQQVI